MSQLPSTHHELYQHFLNGNHIVSRAKELSKLNLVSTDMVLEQSMNMDTKTKAGIIGYAQDYDDTVEVDLNIPLTSSCLQQLQGTCTCFTIK